MSESESNAKDDEATCVSGRYIKVVAMKFTARGTRGDFAWMSKQPEYDDHLFVFNENAHDGYANNVYNGCNDKPFPGGGTAALRPQSHRFVKDGVPRAAGITTGWSVYGGFDEADIKNPLTMRKLKCDLKHILVVVKRHKHIKYVVFSGDVVNDTLVLGCNIFKLPFFVQNKITNMLYKLESVNVNRFKWSHEEIWEEEKDLRLIANMHYNLYERLRQAQAARTPTTPSFSAETSQGHPQKRKIAPNNALISQYF